MTEFVILCGGAFFAGWVDAIVGGGGLIQVPLLFSTLPGLSAASLFGTNKLSSVWGTAFAAWRYGRRIAVPWEIAIPAAAAGFSASYCGALTVALWPRDQLRPIILVLLIAVTVYTYRRKDFGAGSAVAVWSRKAPLVPIAIGAGVGFYDGFFGPGRVAFSYFYSSAFSPLISYVRRRRPRLSTSAPTWRPCSTLSRTATYCGNSASPWRYSMSRVRCGAHTWLCATAAGSFARCFSG